MRILLDCDGILADFVGATLDYLNMGPVVKGYMLTPDQVDGCDIAKSLGLDDFDSGRLYSHWRSAGFASALKPYYGAKDFVRELRKRGDVVVVTTPLKDSLTWCWERTAWLSRHYGLTDVVFTRDKSLVSGDVLIDDHPTQLQNFPGRRILLDRPWNRSADLPRVYSYSEILGAL